MKKEVVYVNPSAKALLKATNARETFTAKYVERIGEGVAQVTLVRYVRGKMKDTDVKIVSDTVDTVVTKAKADKTFENTEAIGQGMNALLRSEQVRRYKEEQAEEVEQVRRRARKLSVNMEISAPVCCETEDQISISVNGNVSEFFNQVQGFAKRKNEVGADRTAKNVEALGKMAMKNFGSIFSMFAK